MNALRRLVVVALYAVAMAYVESAVVAYLRDLYGIDDIVRDLPAQTDRIIAIEIGREAMTVVMLGSVAWLAGRRLQDRTGYFLFAFGLWDIAYYGWLALFTGWPDSPLDWDVLFLLPLPWWGPVLAPSLIAAAMCAGGAAAVLRSQRDEPWRLSRANIAFAAGGVIAVLYAFMADAIAALPDGFEAVRVVRPSEFGWPLFIAGFGAMTWAGLRIAWPRARA